MWRYADRVGECCEIGVRVLSALTTALRSSEYISCTSALSILNPANEQSAFQSSVGWRFSTLSRMEAPDWVLTRTATRSM